ncbi:MAG TPA: acetolactate synthase large subunit [Candidatus Bilamarchaeaceae archaeon]|nr:acetolactate synthase large subunit [Candidatus Bilamarchaeaceae archaeon]
MKVSELMVQCLENEKVEYIFGLPGEENIEFLDALSSSSIRFITTRHEQGAAFAADVYGRIKHAPGVCLSTLGPGALNLATGVANANLDHSPLVAITGQADSRLLHQEQHQYIDIVQAFRPITKWNARINTPDSVPEIVRKAFRTAIREKQGATHIELSNDTAAQKTQEKPLSVVSLPLGRCATESIERAATIINRSRYPIILCGNGVVRMQAHRELIAFAEATHIPVAKTFMSKGTISSKHPLSLGTLGLPGKDHILEEFHQADVVIPIGYDLVEYSPSRWNPDKNKKIICIDTIAAEYVDAHYAVAVEMVGSLQFSLQELAPHIKKRRYAAPRYLKEFIQKERTGFTCSYPFKPQHVLVALRKAMREKDILVSDVGVHKLWISRLFATYRPNTVIISNGLASMGIAVPGAIGAKLAAPDKKIFSANGDGGFLMNMQELETAKRLGIAFTVIIFNDNAYGAIEWAQIRHGKKPFGVKVTNPDFVKLAESFGVQGYRVERAGELEETLNTAARSNELCVVEIPVDYSENKKLLPLS